jgi:hypothetical protein
MYNFSIFPANFQQASSSFPSRTGALVHFGTFKLSEAKSRVDATKNPITITSFLHSEYLEVKS